MNNELRLPISLDTILLGVMVVSYLGFNQIVSAFILLVVGIYAVVDLFLSPRSESECDAKSRREKASSIKFILFLLIVGVAIFAPTVFYMATRANGEPDEHLHDGAFQTELAMRCLVNGKNPYAENYLGTGLERYTLSDAPINPAVYNYVYFPLILWISLPFYLFLTNWIHWYDQRIIYLLCFIAIIFFVTRLTNKPVKKQTLLILLTMNRPLA